MPLLSTFDFAMFEEFFGLTAKPFGKTPDPAFLYESPQHREALARLEYAVEEKELALLVGDIGSGKTTLSRALIDRVGDARPVVLLINPRLTPTQLLRADRPRSRARAGALPQRPARPDPHEAVRAVRAKARAGADDRRGAADSVEGDLRRDPPADQLPARRPEPAQRRADRPARARERGSSATPTRRCGSASGCATLSVPCRSTRPSSTSSTASASPAARAIRSAAKPWTRSTRSAAAFRA